MIKLKIKLKWKTELIKKVKLNQQLFDSLYVKLKKVGA